MAQTQPKLRLIHNIERPRTPSHSGPAPSKMMLEAVRALAREDALRMIGVQFPDST